MIYRTRRVAGALNGGAVLIARGGRSHSTAPSFTINGTAVEALFARKSAKIPPFPSKNGIRSPLAPRSLPLKSPLAISILRKIFVIPFYFLSTFFALFQQCVGHSSSMPEQLERHLKGRHFSLRSTTRDELCPYALLGSHLLARTDFFAMTFYNKGGGLGRRLTSCPAGRGPAAAVARDIRVACSRSGWRRGGRTWRGC